MKALKRFAARARRALPNTAAHFFFFTGLITVTAGCGMIYRPLGFIVGGLVATWIGLMISGESSSDGRR